MRQLTVQDTPILSNLSKTSGVMKLNDGKVVLLIAYQKSEFDNLSENFLKRLREEMMK